MVWTPKFTLWNSTGITKLYTFVAVNYTNAPQSVKKTVRVSNLRGKGEIIIDGGTASWDLELRFALLGDEYTEVASKVDTLESTILLNTPYLFLIDKSISTFYQYNVKRIEPFIYTDIERNLRNNLQKVTAKFSVNSW